MSPFMKVPPEVRNQIYGYLLSTKYTKVDSTDESAEFTIDLTSRSYRVYQFHPAILAVNRQINHEAGHILHENLFVKFMISAPERGLELDKNGLGVVAKNVLASRVTYCASELTMIYGTESDNEGFSIFVFPAEEMTTFCRVLMRRRCTFRSSLSIAITRVPSSTTSILRLLEPFRRLHSLPSVSITGPVSDEYKSILIEKMLKQAPEIDTAMQDVHGIIDQGLQAWRDKDYSIAIAKHKRAVQDISDIQYWPNRVSRSVLKRGVFSGQTFETAFENTLLSLNYNLAIAHLKIGSHSRAHGWITGALEQINPFGQLSGARPGGAGCAKIYSIATQASERLGLVNRAVEEMKEAVRHDPGDSILATELVRLERKMQGGCRDVQVLEGEMCGGAETHTD